MVTLSPFLEGSREAAHRAASTNVQSAVKNRDFEAESIEQPLYEPREEYQYLLGDLSGNTPEEPMPTSTEGLPLAPSGTRVWRMNRDTGRMEQINAP